MRCEDFPCCGHELGCCPDFDPETGAQLNMKCVCGAILPLTSRYSLCEGCIAPDDEDERDFEDDPDAFDEAYDEGEMPENDGCFEYEDRY